MYAELKGGLTSVGRAGLHASGFLAELLEGPQVERGCKVIKWNLILLDPFLLWRVCRLCIPVDLHRFLILLFPHLFDICRLERDDSMKVQPYLELNTREVATGICGNTPGTESGNPCARCGRSDPLGSN